MESPNVEHVPMNPEGALELGMRPCDACTMGWGIYSSSRTETCQDTCEYWKRYCDGPLAERTKNLVDEIMVG